MVAFAVFSLPAASAQTETPRGPRLVDRAERQAAKREAAALVAEGKLDEAQDLVATLTASSPESADGKIQAAQRFMQMAHRFSSRGQTDQVGSVVQRALVLLGEAEQLAATPGLKASARSLAGFLNERYLADPAAAESHYRAAAAHRPEDREIQNRLQRLEEAAEISRRRGEGKGGRG